MRSWKEKLVESNSSKLEHTREGIGQKKPSSSQPASQPAILYTSNIENLGVVLFQALGIKDIIMHHTELSGCKALHRCCSKTMLQALCSNASGPDPGPVSALPSALFS